LRHTPDHTRPRHPCPEPPHARFAEKALPGVPQRQPRRDEYYWLRDDKRESPDMLAYVKAENAYADAKLAHIKPLETKVYNEIIGRLQQDDSTVPTS
jgi:oligopeptidase B